MNTCLDIVVFQPRQIIPSAPTVVPFRKYLELQCAAMLDPTLIHSVITDDDPMPTKQRLIAFWFAHGYAEKFRQLYTYIPSAEALSA